MSLKRCGKWMCFMVAGCAWDNALVAGNWRATVMGRFVASWELVQTSLATLASDKELILLPMISAAVSILAMALLSGWYMAAYWPELRLLHANTPMAGIPHRGFVYVLLFILYVINYFAVIFCNVALMAVANNRMGGGSWKMRQGLELAWDRRGVIFQWALLSATVGIILQMIAERVGFVGRLLTRLVGLAWALATFFIVPVLAFDNLPPLEALKRSAQLFRKTWGESVVAGLSCSLIFMLPLSAGFILWFAALKAVSSTGALIVLLAVGMIFVAVFGAVISATTSIYKVALYNYALSGRLHGGFSEDQFQSAFVPKN
jgi:hypothetical protein